MAPSRAPSPSSSPDPTPPDTLPLSAAPTRSSSGSARNADAPGDSAGETVGEVSSSIPSPVSGVHSGPLSTSGPADLTGLTNLTDPSAALRALDAVRGQAFDDPTPHAISSESGLSESLERGFEILGELGRGGFGVVYRARDRLLGREVAIKCSLRGAHELSKSERRRILSEAVALASVDHPNVVRVYSAGESEEGQIQIVMELLRGKSLYEWIKLNGPASADEAAHIGLKLCGALAALHAAKLVHRDVKPANVMRVEGGRIVLLDLGFASELEHETRSAPRDIAGTLLLMAPEQLTGGAPLDARADIYALGVTLYWLVSARYPIEGRTQAEIAIAVREGRSVPLRDRRPSIPPEFAALIDRATALAPRDRFASAGEFERALQRWLGAHTPDVRLDPQPAAAGPSPGSSERARACSSCGALRVGDESYCKSCGSMLVYPCPRCTSALDLDASYCTRCGLDVTQWRAAEEHLRAAHAALRRGEFDLARRSLAAAREIQPAHPELARLGAAVEERAKNFSLAAAAARRAEVERRFEAAREAWSAALQLAPDSSEARSARERAAELARSTALASAVTQVQRAFEAADWSSARVALQQLERLAGERDAALAQRAREQVLALERRVQAARVAADAAYERRDAQALESASAALRELGEGEEQLALRDEELDKLQARDEVLEWLEAGDVPQALRLLRELRKRLSDWPRVEVAELEKRVLAQRSERLDGAQAELAAVLKQSGLEAGEALLEDLRTLRPDEELLAALEALVAKSRSRRRAWVITRNTLAATALCGLAAATVWTLRLLRESGERGVLAGEGASAPAAPAEVLPGTTPAAPKPGEKPSIGPQSEVFPQRGPVVSTNAWPTRAVRATQGFGRGVARFSSGTALALAQSARDFAAAQAELAEQREREARAAEAERLRIAQAEEAERLRIALAAEAERLNAERAAAEAAAAVRPPVGSEPWRAELDEVLAMGGAGKGDGPTLAGQLWSELEAEVSAGFAAWSGPDDKLSALSEQIEWQLKLVLAYDEYYRMHEDGIELRARVCKALWDWNPLAGLPAIEHSLNQPPPAKGAIEAAPFNPETKDWLRALLELDPELFRYFDVDATNKSVVAVAPDSTRRIPARLRERTTRESFVVVPRGEQSYYICESKLGPESLGYEQSKSAQLGPAVDSPGVLPHAALSWVERRWLQLPTRDEWEFTFKHAPPYSMLRATMDSGREEICLGREPGELELYACGPNSFATPADTTASIYAWRPVRRAVLRRATLP